VYALVPQHELLMQGFVGSAFAKQPLQRWNRATKSIVVTTGNGHTAARCGGAASSTHRSFEAAIGPAEDLAFRLNNDLEKNMFHMCHEELQTVVRLCLGDNLQPAHSALERTPRFEPLFLDTAEARMQSEYGISAATAKCVVDSLYEYRATGYVAGELLRTLSSTELSTADARALSLYCEDVDISSLFHFAPLPNSLRDSQLEAIRRKFNISKDNTDEAELQRLSEIYFCLGCMATKAFVVENTDAGHVACGSIGIPHVVFNADKKEVECRQCTHASRLFRVTMAGMVVRIGRHSHILCTDCGSITLLDPFATCGNEYICGTCKRKRIATKQREFFQLDVCALTGCDQKLPRDTHDLLVTDDTGVQRIVAYCKMHKSMAEQMHKMTTVVSEMNTAIIRIIEDNAAPRRGALGKKEVARFANAARRCAPFSLLGGRR
jgi:hypothetical protein